MSYWGVVEREIDENFSIFDGAVVERIIAADNGRLLNKIFAKASKEDVRRILETRDSAGRNLAHIAAIHGSTECFKILLSHCQDKREFILDKTRSGRPFYEEPWFFSTFRIDIFIETIKQLGVEPFIKGSEYFHGRDSIFACLCGMRCFSHVLREFSELVFLFPVLVNHLPKEAMKALTPFLQERELAMLELCKENSFAGLVTEIIRDETTVRFR